MSRSGYYAWLNRSGADSLREERDYLDDTLAWTSSFSSKSISKGEMMIHSDQGFHYTHPGYQRLVVDLGLVQSMSRRGNCLDNAPIESFFGHLKNYVTNRSYGSTEKIRERVGDYISYYNYERGQWNLKKMTPKQYQDYLIAA